jgi:hypothetical protein
MMPIYVRELKELAPVLAIALTCAVLAGVNFTGPLSRQFDDILVPTAVGAFVLGMVQGVLDRWRRGDPFALHRPIAAARMEAARTLAGGTTVFVTLLAVVIAHRLATIAEIAEEARMRSMGFTLLGAWRPKEHLGGAEIALTGGLLLAAWAVTRFAVGAARIRWAVPALIVLPAASWSLLARTATLPGTMALLLALALLFSLGSGLCLAGDRR